MGLSVIVFPAMIGIAVFQHLSTPAEKRTVKAKKYFQRFVLGSILIWAGVELMDRPEKLISIALSISGAYLCLWNGINLLNANDK